MKIEKVGPNCGLGACPPGEFSLRFILVYPEPEIGENHNSVFYSCSTLPTVTDKRLQY